MLLFGFLDLVSDDYGWMDTTRQIDKSLIKDLGILVFAFLDTLFRQQYYRFTRYSF